jgi:hypothetical protein
MFKNLYETVHMFKTLYGSAGTYVQKFLKTCWCFKNLCGQIFMFRHTNLPVPLVKNRCAKIHMIIDGYGPVRMFKAHYG